MKRGEVTLQPIGEAECGAALELLEAGLGNGYLNEADLRDYQDGKRHGIAHGASLGEELVGVVLAQMLDGPRREELEASLRRVGACLADHRLGILQSIVVKPTCRGRGVGSALTRVALGHIEKVGGKASVTVSWESGGGAASAGMFERIGFAQIARVPDFWKEDSRRKGYLCPRCGNPCSCAAIIYLRDF